MSTKFPHPESTGKPKVALIAGPTASGKSDLAVRLALALGESGRRSVIINADSAQVYADLGVLSARPTVEEMQGIAHQLFGEWDGAEACSAADWACRAQECIALAHAEAAIPILVGGTGLYLRTLLDGIAPVPPILPEIRTQVRAMDTQTAYAALQAEDPGRAAQLAPADAARILRALEVVRSTGRTLLQWQAERSGAIGPTIDLHAALLLPERQWLYERCDRRFELMIRQGAVAEVEALLARNLDPALPIMRAIGVPEIARFLRGEWSQEELLTRGAQATRNYAKRQYTWFRHQCPEQWARIESSNITVDVIFVRLLRN